MVLIENEGLTVIDKLQLSLLQMFETTTDTLPVAAEAPQVVVMELVPCPDVMVTPAGTVQV